MSWEVLAICLAALLSLCLSFSTRCTTSPVLLFWLFLRARCVPWTASTRESSQRERGGVGNRDSLSPRFVFPAGDLVAPEGVGWEKGGHVMQALRVQRIVRGHPSSTPSLMCLALAAAVERTCVVDALLGPSWVPSWRACVCVPVSLSSRE